MADYGYPIEPLGSYGFPGLGTPVEPLQSYGFPGLGFQMQPLESYGFRGLGTPIEPLQSYGYKMEPISNSGQSWGSPRVRRGKGTGSKTCCQCTCPMSLL